MTASIDPAIPLDTDESVEWTGRPRVTTVLPAVVSGAVLVAVATAAAVVGETPVALGVVPLAVAIPLWRYVALRGVQYVVTDEALYVKRGVLTRSVAQAHLETVQNSAFGQDVTGSLFGYGSVTFEVAGGEDLSFRAVEDPRSVRELVDRTASNDDGLGGRDRRESTVPGDLAGWRLVRDEIRAIRRSLEG